MGVLKGIFDAVTIMPDSIGWDACMARLGEGGMEKIGEGIHFGDGFWSGMLQTAIAEATGDKGKRVRYCADMMISGHTYFVVIFAYSAYKQIEYNAKVFPSNRTARLARQFSGSILSACVLLEVLLVAASRFHYTVDMLAAIILVILLFDSMHVEQLAVDWSEGFEFKDQNFRPNMSLRHTVLEMFSNKAQEEKDEAGTEGETIGAMRYDKLKILPSQPKHLTNFRHVTSAAPWSAYEPDLEDEETDQQRPAQAPTPPQNSLVMESSERQQLLTGSTTPASSA